MIASLSGTRGTGRRAWAGILLGLILAAGCAPLEPVSGPPDLADAAAARARSLSDQGEHGAAADAYLRLASATAGAARERYLILAARERLRAGRTGGAQAIVDNIGAPTADENRLVFAVVAADVAVAGGRPADALALLDAAPPTDEPRATAEILRIRGEALFRVDQPVAGTRALLEREIWLDEPAAIEANHALLWASYQRFGAALPVQPPPSGDAVLDGWLALGRVAATAAGRPGALGAGLVDWQRRYPGHPAGDRLVPALLADSAVPVTLPERVALLLPLSGAQAASGAAIRDGFLAGHFQEAGFAGRPELRVYDVAALGAETAYRQAQADGAQFVVGPLLKESVQALAETGIAIPTLALNFLPDDAPVPPGLYQFGLAPEDEARQAADRAIAAGQYRAIALLPVNDWGERILASFRERFEALGGVIIDFRFYDPGAPDFSDGIQDVLLINESRARKQRLSANLGVDLGFEPRRRDDVDLILLAATDAAGKLIRPQLRFFFAGDLPTYSTSAIYVEGSRNNADLNGILFPDMPWMIAPGPEAEAVRATLDRHWPGQAQRRARLFAMGFDAYRLVPALASGELARQGQVAGVTGTLSMDEAGRIHRRLQWAKITDGRAVALAPLAAAEPVARTGPAPSGRPDGN